MNLPKKSSLRPQVNDRLARLNRWYQKPIAQVSTALLLTITTIAFFAAFAIRPTLSTIAQLVKKIEDQRLIKAQLDQKVAALATAESEYSLVRTKLPNLYQAVPTSPTIDTIIKQIEAASRSIPVPLNNLNLAEVALTPDSSNETALFLPINFSLDITADYQSLTNFLTTLTNNKRLMTLESIILTSDVNHPTSGINLKLKVNAYYQPELSF